MIKKVLSILVAFLLIQTSVFALSIPKQDESIYVNDYAFVLSETTENELISINQTSDYETGGYVVVATFDFVDEDLYDFSYYFFILFYWCKKIQFTMVVLDFYTPMISSTLSIHCPSYT